MSFRSPALFAGVAVTALLGGAGVAYAATHSSSPAAAQTASLSGSPASPDPASSAPPSSAPASSAPAATMPPAKRAWGRFPGLGLGFGGLGGLGGGAIHGQLTVPKSGGGYQTVDVQSGTVSSVSSTSITVKSADGFTATYTVTSSTEVNAESAGIGAVKSGDTVFVLATTSGSSATASDVTDITSIKNSRGAFGFPDPVEGKLPPQGAPAGSGTAGNV